MKSKILVVTASDEPNVEKVMQFLPSELVFRLNTDELLYETSTFSFQVVAGGTSWHFRNRENEVRSDEIKSIWYRRPARPKARQEVLPKYSDFAENEAHKSLQSMWSTISEETVLWMNHPRVLRELEFNQPYQLLVASHIGLSVPETLITNNPKEVSEFFERWGGEVAIKTFGGSLTRDQEGSLLAVFTNRVSEEDLRKFSDEIRYAPVLLQSYVPKALELRITVVGDKFFTCAIHSQDSPRTKDDWRRYDFERVRHEPYNLPLEIQAKLKTLMTNLKLVFGAIDMIVTPDGDYVFLEVNPSGQWGWIERITGMSISKAIADILIDPPIATEKIPLLK